MNCFCDTYELRNLIKQSACYKNSENSTCIDLMLANVPSSFYSICVLRTGLSVFHLITLTVLRKSYKKFHSRKSLIGLESIFQRKTLGKTCYITCPKEIL